MSIFSNMSMQTGDYREEKLLAADPFLEEPPSDDIYEEDLAVMCMLWTVRASFSGRDYYAVKERRRRAERIINRFDNELDAHITQKRAELEAELCLLCGELEID